MSGSQTEVVKAYKISDPGGSLVIVIPKFIRKQTDVSKGTHFQVQIDGEKLVYEPINLSQRG